MSKNAAWPDTELQRLIFLAMTPGRNARDDAELSTGCSRLSPSGWDRLWQLSENQGVTSLIHANLGSAGSQLPDLARQVLLGLVLRQRHASRIQQAAFAEVLKALNAARVPALVLKGGALCHLIYESPALRPMSDLDLLIPPGQIGRAQELLFDLGFNGAGDIKRRQARADSMHLEPLTCTREGMRLAVELHHRLSREQIPGHIGLSEPESDSMEFRFGADGPIAEALRPEKMLWHLCHHLVDHCIFSVRLLWMWDVRAYAVRYEDSIDWSALAREIPLAASTLSLLDQVWPLPPGLRGSLGLKAPPGSLTPSPDLRQWPTPWTKAMREKGALAFAGQLFFPSAWWLRLYHGLGARSAVWPYRFWLHPVHMVRRVWYWRSHTEED